MIVYDSNVIEKMLYIMLKLDLKNIEHDMQIRRFI